MDPIETIYEEVWFNDIADFWPHEKEEVDTLEEELKKLFSTTAFKPKIITRAVNTPHGVNFIDIRV